MKCVICPNDAGKKKTCGPKCLSKLKSLNGTRLHKEGISKGWNDRNR